MSDQSQPEPTTALGHAEGMLDYLRGVPAGHGHDLARAMLASAGCYLREVFGQQHAVDVAASLLPAVLGVAEVAGLGEPEGVAAPAVVLH